MMPDRPDLVTKALKSDSPIYYFGIGSNMSRTKVENRSIDGTKINIISMEPAVVHGHRLAFNMKAFPPLEPVMGSIEPINRNEDFNEPLLPYKYDECHGALILFSAEDYEKIALSEGIGKFGRYQGYEEMIVAAIPYGDQRQPVQAVALRARPHVRLKKDICPSLRYMNILREGAMELGLKPCYQEWLMKYPAQTNPALLSKIAANNFVFTFGLAFGLKCPQILRVQSFLISKVHAPCTMPLWMQIASQAATAIILLPGSVVGFLLLAAMRVTGHSLPQTFKTMLDHHKN